MKTIVFLCILAVAGAYAPAGAVTLTFDDIPAGMYPGQYLPQYHVYYDGTFEVADHSGSSWGPPRSGNNVLINWSSHLLPAGAGVSFGYEESVLGGFVRTPIRSYGGFFSTQPGTVIRMVGYHQNNQNPVVSVDIGDPNGAWENRFAGISSSTVDITYVQFYNVSSDDALFRYCADDVTVEFVPEPSALTLLSLALASVGIGVVRRRR